MTEKERLDCEEAIRWLALFLDQELSRESAAAVQEHLETCRSCYDRAEFERRLRERIRSSLAEDSVTEAFEDRMRVLLEQLPGRS
jgi:anti-sigma factor (TIGR02949 family)